MSNKTQNIKRRYNRISRVYDLVDRPMENMFSKWRGELVKNVRGKVLEVGIGTGNNIPYYPDGIEVTGIDFSPKMLSIAKNKAYKYDKDATLIEMDAQDMDFEDNTFDTVVTACVFCSVPDPVKGLREIRRVSKPGSFIYMLEHVRSNKKIIGPVMDLLNPVPLHLYGANINRKTVDNLIKAGFSKEKINVKQIWLDIVKLLTIENDKIN